MYEFALKDSPSGPVSVLEDNSAVVGWSCEGESVPGISVELPGDEI